LDFGLKIMARVISRVGHRIQGGFGAARGDISMLTSRLSDEEVEKL